MPNISAHMIVALKVAEKLNINSNDFIKGNLLPDIIEEEGHYRVRNGIYLVPDIDTFFQYNSIREDLYKGYLTHLLLDKHFLKEYLEKKHPDKNCFKQGIIYDDYNYLNGRLISKFNLDVPLLEKILRDFNYPIKEDLLAANILYLKQRKEGKPQYLDFDSFSKFLTEISDTIAKELLEYENKYN